jgi:hypothetical protein
MNIYPKTEKYDSKWIEENWLEPNPLQLIVLFAMTAVKKL